MNRIAGRLLPVALVAMAALATAGCESAEERAVGHYERGLALLEEGSLDKAIIELRNAMRLQREFNDAQRVLGDAYDQKGNTRAAIGAYRAVLERTPDDAALQMKAGQLILTANDPRTARGHLEAAARLEPENPDARSSHAAVLLRLGEDAAAVVEAEAAIALDPDNVAGHVVLVSERLRAEDVETALGRLDALLADWPEELAYHVLRLRAVEIMGDNDALGAQLERMATLFPDQPSFRNALAQWKIRNGDLAGAEEILRELADAGGYEEALRLTAFLRGVRNDATAARIDLVGRVGDAEDPVERAQLKKLLAELDRSMGRTDDARATLEEIVAAGDAPAIVNEARVELALIALNEGDKERALALAEAVIADDELNGGALAVRASVAIDDLRPDDAIADLRVAQGGDPDNVRLVLLEATAQERAGNLEIAGERLAAASRMSDFAPQITQRYANFLRSQGNLSGAEAALSESASRHPTDASALTALAEVRLRLGDATGAGQAAAALRALDGGEMTAERIEIARLGLEGRTDESMVMLRELAERSDAESGTIGTLLANYMRAGETEKAKAFLADAMARDPDNIRLMLFSAEMQFAEGDAAGAETTLRTALDNGPSDVVTHTALIRLLMATGRMDEATEAAEIAAAATTNAEGPRFLLAQMKERRGDFDGAIREYESLFNDRPDSPIYANNYATLLAEHYADDPEKLALAARVAQRLRGYDVPHFQDTYGWVLFLSGDVVNAIPFLEQAAERLPDYAIVRYHLGRAYAANGQVEEARGHLQAALDLEEDFVKAESARLALGQLE